MKSMQRRWPSRSSWPRSSKTVGATGNTPRYGRAHMRAIVPGLGAAEAAEEAPAAALGVEAGLAGADAAVVAVEDLGRQVGEAVHERAQPDVLLADQLVGLAVVAGELQLVADDALADRADRDRAGELGGARERRRVDHAV